MLITATDIEEIKRLWELNHDVLFEREGKEYFAFHEVGAQVLCDDGRGCKSRAIVTSGDLLDEKMPSGETVAAFIQASEIKYIY